MRIRQIKPAFWNDSRLSRLSERTRLFYIGLWMIADDGGWFLWDAAQVGSELYSYERPASRERRATAMLGELVEAGRVKLLDCGHGTVPTMTAHQHLSGLTKQVHTFEQAHKRVCLSTNPQTPAETRGNPQTPASGNGHRLGNGQVSEGLGQVTRDPRVMTLQEVEEEARRIDAAKVVH